MKSHKGGERGKGRDTRGILGNLLGETEWKERK
jgi:hypothetical protein